MIAAVRKLASGDIYVSAVATEALASAMGGHQGKGSSRGGTKFLSYREHQVFRLLTAGKSVGQIGAQLGLASNTVSTYRLRILEKTATKNDVELALYAQRHVKSKDL